MRWSKLCKNQAEGVDMFLIQFEKTMKWERRLRKLVCLEQSDPRGEAKNQNGVGYWRLFTGCGETKMSLKREYIFMKKKKQKKIQNFITNTMGNYWRALCWVVSWSNLCGKILLLGRKQVSMLTILRWRQTRGKEVDGLQAYQKGRMEDTLVKWMCKLRENVTARFLTSRAGKRMAFIVSFEGGRSLCALIVVQCCEFVFHFEQVRWWDICEIYNWKC